MGACATKEPSESTEERAARELRERKEAVARFKAKQERERRIELTFINLKTTQRATVVVRAGDTIGGAHAGVEGYRWGLRRALFGGIEVGRNPNKAFHATPPSQC
jgi:hypothetical protein